MPLRLIRLIACRICAGALGLRHLKQPAQCQMAGPVTLIPLCRGVWRDRMLSLGGADAIPQIPPALIEPRARPRLPGALCLLAVQKRALAGFGVAGGVSAGQCPSPRRPPFRLDFFGGMLFFTSILVLKYGSSPCSVGVSHGTDEGRGPSRSGQSS